MADNKEKARQVRPTIAILFVPYLCAVSKELYNTWHCIMDFSLVTFELHLFITRINWLVLQIWIGPNEQNGRSFGNI